MDDIAPPLMAHQVASVEEHWNTPSWAHLWEQRCVDRDTEYLTPSGWRRICDYAGEAVAQWDEHTREVTFVTPSRYVKTACDDMVRINGDGFDQKLSYGHSLLEVKRRKLTVRRILAHQYLDLGPSAWRMMPGTFTFRSGSGLDISDSNLRLIIAVYADGNFSRRAVHTFLCNMRLKKDRKKIRIEALLSDCGVQYTKKSVNPDGFHLYKFHMNSPDKRFGEEFWKCNEHQLSIIRDEVIHWDGSFLKNGGMSYYSRYKSDCDIIQWAFGSNGYKTRVFESGSVWCCHINIKESKSPNYFVRRHNVSMDKSVDGYAYCFTVPSGCLLLRRSGYIFPTGNCGKSATVIRQACRAYREDLVDALVVVAPNGVHSNWAVEEIPRWMEPGVPWRVAEYTSRRSGTRAHELALDSALGARSLACLCVTYDALLTDAAKRWLWAFLSKRRAMLVVDESSAVKSVQSDRSQVLVKAARYAVLRRVLNGTPIERDVMDLYQQVRILDPDYWLRELGCVNEQAFKRRFMIVKQIELKSKQVNPKSGTRKVRKFPKVVGTRDLDQLGRALGKISDRVLREQVMDLPPKVFTWCHHDMTARQREVYDRLKKEAMAAFGQEVPCEDCAGQGLVVLGWDGADRVEADCPRCAGSGVMLSGTMTAIPPAVRLLRLQQVVCGYAVDDDRPGEPVEAIPGENPRLAALEGVLRDSRGPWVTFSRFGRDVALIHGLCRDMGLRVERYEGATSPEDRTRIRRAFQAGEVDVFDANTAAAATGIKLTAASTVVYYSNTFRLGHRLQSEDRAVGPDNRGLVYVDVCCPGTVDERIVRNLRDKMDVASQVTGDRLREWLL